MASRTQGFAAAAMALALGLAGCGSDTATEGTESPETSAQAPNPAAGPTAPAEGGAPAAGGPGAPAAPAPPTRRAYTIKQFIDDNRIQETQLHPGQPGAPTVEMPMPPGWIDAGSATPAWAWRAIYLNDPAMSVDPPNVVTLVSRLTGPGAARVLAYAPGELRNMAEFQPDEGSGVIKVSGFNAYVMAGTFLRSDGVRRAIVQMTMVAPTEDGAFIMQSNADGLPDQLGLLKDTMTLLDDQTNFKP